MVNNKVFSSIIPEVGEKYFCPAVNDQAIVIELRETTVAVRLSCGKEYQYAPKVFREGFKKL